MVKKAFPFLNLSQLKLLNSGNNKFLFQSDAVRKEEDYSKKYQLGGQDNYFINLSQGAYRRDGKLTERTWKFLFKHFVVAKKVFEKAEKRRLVFILDIGCSLGFLRRILESNIKKSEKIIYVGIDLSRNKLEKAVFNENSLESGAEGDKIPSVYIRHNAAKILPLKSNSFDFVISFQLIKYLSRRENFNLFKEVFRALKGGGLFFLSSDPIFSKRFDLNLKEKGELKRKGYKSFWQEENLIKVLRQIGFERIFVPPSLSFIQKESSFIKYLQGLLPEEIIGAISIIGYSRSERERLFIFKKSPEK